MIFFSDFWIRFSCSRLEALLEALSNPPKFVMKLRKKSRTPCDVLGLGENILIFQQNVLEFRER
jgi:hypothetical protein